MKNVGVTILVLLALCGSAPAVEVLEPGYVVQTYVTYSEPGLGYPKNMKFDDDGNLYVVHSYDNTIWRIIPDGTASLFVSGINTPYGIEWTGGTSYGDYLYVVTYQEIIRVGLEGTISEFAHGYPAGGSALTVDRTGNYGGYLYLTTGGQDHIYRVDTDGSITMFSDWPGWTDGGGPVGIHFDPEVDYSELMYVATYFGPENADVSGLFALDASGIASRFTDDLVAALHIDFDETGYFGEEMFVVARSTFDENYGIWRVGSGGTATEFARTTVSDPYGLAFGPNGAMYVAEYSVGDEMVIVSRIIPEPATLLLLGLGAVMLRRKR